MNSPLIRRGRWLPIGIGHSRILIFPYTSSTFPQPFLSSLCTTKIHEGYAKAPSHLEYHFAPLDAQRNHYREWNARTLRYLHACIATRPNQQTTSNVTNCPSSRTYRLISLPSSPVIYSPLLPLVRSPLSYPINTTAPRPQHLFCIIHSVMEGGDLHWRRGVFGRSRDWENFELKHV